MNYSPWLSKIIQRRTYERWVLAQQLVSDQSIPVATLSYIFMYMQRFLNIMYSFIYHIYMLCVS